MQRCRRVGIDVTKRCNLRCRTCFYYWRSDFNAKQDKPLDKVIEEVVSAVARGCDHAVLVGQGEPGLWPPVVEWVAACRAMGVSTSIITNGCLDPQKYAAMYAAGLNHLHVSVHGMGEVYDRIVGVPGAHKRQDATLKWLKDTGHPWRMNMTVQQENYKSLTEIARRCIGFGCRHIVSLGLIPHYEWGDKTKRSTVEVDPSTLRPFIQATCDVAVDAGVWITVRYHPMCQIDQRYRKYITNARYVLYDPGEWEYGNAGKSDSEYWASAVSIGDSVAVQGHPCDACTHKIHCGGWNRVNVSSYPDSISPIKDPIDQTPGFLHEQNPFNTEFNGWF